MAQSSDPRQRFLDLHRRAGRRDDLPVGVGSPVLWPRGFYRGGAAQLYDPTDLGAGQKISAKRRKNKKGIRHTLELRRFSKSAAHARSQAESCVAGLSARRASDDRSGEPRFCAVNSEPVTPPFFYGW